MQITNFIFIAAATALAVLLTNFDGATATSEPVCQYKNGNIMKFLKYFPSGGGEEYIYKGSDGKCVEKATCQKNYELKIEKCVDIGITCDNLKDFPAGDFPSCCVKCN